MIQPIIVMVESQRGSVERLVAHCKKIDGTEMKVIPLTPQDDAGFKVEHHENEKACRAAFSLHHAAKAMKGKPFIWLEHDAVPLKKGWAEKLSKEYDRLGKPFMLSSDSNPPDDLVGGIGVYGPETHWMIPTNLKHRPGSKSGSGWDLWMLENIRPLISRTPLIQHSYGVYTNGRADTHRFPRDASMLRKDALIFHRDAFHHLFEEANRRPADKVWIHAGDLGDSVYHLEVIRRIGGGKLMLGSELGVPNFRSHCREPMTPKRAENLAALARVQSYISGVEHWNGMPRPEWTNLNLFRETFKGRPDPSCTNLQRAGLRRFGLQVQDETKPWLSVPKKDASLAGKIIVSRSPRYHDPAFPWRELVREFSSKMVFVGLDDEYKAFSEFGRVERYSTKNLLDVAVAIASGCLFMGNQSCPYAIAEGLKVPAVQESWVDNEPNCLFQRGDLLNLTSDLDRISTFMSPYI